jgi:hypothetical protein
MRNINSSITGFFDVVKFNEIQEYIITNNN